MGQLGRLCKHFRMLFATATVAARIERAERTLITEGARAAARRIGDPMVYLAESAGGAAVFAGHGSPFNKFIGLGFEPLDAGQLETIERELHRRGTPVRVELSTLADPEFGAALTGRGYVLNGFENVLGLQLTSAPNAGDAVRSVQVSRTGPGDYSSWLEVVSTGFLHPDTFDGPASTEAIDRSTLEQVFQDMSHAPGYVHYLARREGVIAGGGSLRLSEGIAQMCGAATLPQHRRRGVQTALLRERLLDAAAQGADLAIVTTQPGSKSQQNVQRHGFQLLYARAVLIKDEPR